MVGYAVRENSSILTLERPRDAANRRRLPLVIFRITLDSSQMSQNCHLCHSATQISHFLVYIAWSLSHIKPGYTSKSGSRFPRRSKLSKIQVVYLPISTYIYLYLPISTYILACTQDTRTSNGYAHTCFRTLSTQWNQRGWCVMEEEVESQRWRPLNRQ